jgi:class 3 adenylate cyclase
VNRYRIPQTHERCGCATSPARRDPGERRLVTAPFADVVNSTALAEEMDPEDWASIMSHAIDLMTEAVERCC